MSNTKLNKTFSHLMIIGSVSLLTNAIMVNSSQAATFTFLGGRQDNFATSDGPELASPSQGNLLYYENSTIQNAGVTCAQIFPRCETKNFDQFVNNRNFRHNFDLSSVTGTIVSAVLETKLRGNGSNDTIGLRFFDEQGNIIEESGNRVAWGRFLGSGNSSDGLVNTSWSRNIERTFTFDLANLPLAPQQNPNIVESNLLGTLNNVKFLDVGIQDDTYIDYVQLTIETQEIQAESVPESSNLLGIIGLGVFGLVPFMWKNGK